MVDTVVHKLNITNKNKAFARSVTLLNAHEFCSYPPTSAKVLFTKSHVDIEVNGGAISYPDFLQLLIQRPLKITDVIITSNKNCEDRKITSRHKAIDAERSIIYSMNVNYANISHPKPEVIDGHFAMAFNVLPDEEMTLEIHGHQLSGQAAEMIDAMYKPLLKPLHQ